MTTGVEACSRRASTDSSATARNIASSRVRTNVSGIELSRRSAASFASARRPRSRALSALDRLRAGRAPPSRAARAGRTSAAGRSGSARRRRPSGGRSRRANRSIAPARCGESISPSTRRAGSSARRRLLREHVGRGAEAARFDLAQKFREIDDAGAAHQQEDRAGRGSARTRACRGSPGSRW